MANIVFDIPERFDSDLANEGVWFEIETPKGALIGKFKCRLMDMDATAYRTKFDHVTKELKRNLRNKDVDHRAIELEVFLRASLVDWAEVKSGGKDVPYSLENSRAFFSQQGTQYVRDRLQAEVQDPDNYDLDDKVAVTKN